MIMGRKLMVFGLFLGSSAAWGNTPRRGITNLQKQLMKNATSLSEIERNTEAEICIDLSGHWKGSCVGSDENGVDPDPYEEEITLKQEQCNQLIFDEDDGDPIDIPGSMHMTNTEEDIDSVVDTTGFADWHLGGEVLRIYYTISLTSLPPDAAMEYVGAGFSDYRLVNGKLVITSESSGYSSYVSGLLISSEVCEYELVTP